MAAITPVLNASSLAVDLTTEPYAKWKLIPPATTAGVRYLSNYFGTKKMYSTSLNDESFSAAVTQLPFNQWYWKYYIQDFNLATNVSHVCWMSMTYYIKFYQRQVLNDD